MSLVSNTTLTDYHDPTELAWAGGLFVGEGCVTMVRSRNSSGTYLYLKLDIRMYDVRAIQRFMRITGAGYTKTFSKARNRTVHSARAVGRSAERILAILWPYLEGTEKGDQALIKAVEIGVADWITGSRTDIRPQLHDRPRGRKAG